MTNAGDFLAPGTRLDELEIGRVLGAGGFGVTYLARDMSLDARRAVKEYLPRDWGTRRGDGTVGPRTRSDAEDYRWGLERFLEEARILARFDHRNLVRVYRVFEARGTAYMVTEYVEGRTLKKEAEATGSLTEARVWEVMDALMDGLAKVHGAELLHRDIKPENVMVRPAGTPVLIDFGAARQAMGGHSRSLTAVLTPGYAPIEQYSARGHQGPWTDIYALGALAYWALSGKAPIEATERVEEDPLRPVEEVARGHVSARLAAAINTALAMKRTSRPQSLEEWRALLDRPKPPPPPPPKPPKEEETVEWRRRLGVVAAAGLVAAALVAAALEVRSIYLRPGLGSEETSGISETVPDAPVPAINGEPNSGGDVAEPVVDGSRTPESPVPPVEIPPVPERPEIADVATPVPEAVAEELGPDRAAARAEPASARPSSVLEGNALLVVETTPPGAEVLVDGESVGETPLERSDIRAGVREVTLRHPHYETARIPDQNFEDGVALRVERVLERGVGRLTVTAMPREAWVEVDGERLAEDTPVTLEDLPAGALEVRLGALEHRAVAVEVEIPKDGLARLERTLEPITYGTLTLVLDPSDATVTLPEVESSYRPGMRLPDGPHRVVVRGEGYREAERTVDVSGTTRVRIELERWSAGEVFRDCDGCPEMVVIPAGEFRMGCASGRDCYSDEQPVHAVRISRPFALSKHEVTQGQWEAVMGSNPSGFSECGPSCPVEGVSWDNVQEFIGRLNARAGGVRYRLPTEAEWEYAARAGTSGDYYGNLDAIRVV